MHPANYSAQFLDIGDKLCVDLDGEVDMGEMLQAIADFDRKLFYRQFRMPQNSFLNWLI